MQEKSEFQSSTMGFQIPTIPKTYILEVGLYYSKTGPFGFRPTFDHLNTRHHGFQVPF